MYDIIGDIHGHAAALVDLLRAMGYESRGHIWRHPHGRIPVFVGDIIDRGPEIRSAVNIVRTMSERGAAVVVMGNHEYNALCWHSSDENGKPLRSHNEVHLKQHRETIDAYRAHATEMSDLLSWIARLPLAWQDAEIRVVHAAWDPALAPALEASPSPFSDLALLRRSARFGSQEFHLAETLLKGVEIPLPSGISYLDKDGTPRYSTRIKWWLDYSRMQTGERISLSELAMPPADHALPHVTVPARVLRSRKGYTDHRALFLGHYWLSGEPKPLAPRVACTDYSIARGGKLCAYRWDHILPLTAEQFVCVNAA